jgi:hypothetical protein
MRLGVGFANLLVRLFGATNGCEDICQFSHETGNFLGLAYCWILNDGDCIF